MITTINEFKQYIIESKKYTQDLIIVDVQKEFDKYFNNNYLNELNKYTNNFTRVFQIIDTIDTDKNSYIFNNQTKVYHKEYGGELSEDMVEDYFLPNEVEDIKERLLNVNTGDLFKTMYNEYFVYIGGQYMGGHEWFYCSNELAEFFNKLYTDKRQIILVGGAENECLYSIYIIMKAFNIDVEINKEFTYNVNGCKFEDTDEELNIMINENNSNNIKFIEETLNYQHRQYDIHMDMLIDNNIVAYADYSLFEGKIHIKMIEALVRNKGYGVALMKELANRYGYENLERNQLTPDGVNMRKKLDNYFNFDYNKYKESQNKHFNISIIEEIRKKHKFVADFMSDMCMFGYKTTWNKWLNDIDKYKQYDFNDISDICEWIKNSATNNNDPNTNVPEYIKTQLNKLL